LADKGLIPFDIAMIGVNPNASIRVATPNPAMALDRMDDDLVIRPMQ